MKEQKNEKNKKRVPISVTIEAEQKQWLDEHPEINLSGLVQKSIEDMRRTLEGMRNKDKKSGGD
jgi:cobalamin-dependent methionine synthase I